MNRKLCNIFPNIIIQNNFNTFHLCKTHSISEFVIEIERSYQIGVVGAMHLCEDFDPLFSKKIWNCEMTINKPLRLDEFRSDEGFVFPQCDEFRSSFFIGNSSFNGSSPRCRWGLRGTRCNPSAGRNLSARGFSHGWGKGEEGSWEFLRKWENERFLSVHEEKRIFWWQKWLIFIEKSLQRPCTRDLMQI